MNQHAYISVQILHDTSANDAICSNGSALISP